MKFGYRDRIILMVVVIIVILALGIFVFIKPKWEKLNTNKKTRDTLKTEWDAKLLEFDRIPLRQENIRKRYKTGTELAANFTDEMSSVDLAKFLQDNFINTPENLKDENVKLKGTVSISDSGTASLNYYYFTPNIVTYPLYEAADLDGSLAAAAQEKMKDSNILAGRSSQTVGSSNASFVITINREDTMKLIDAVKSYADSHKDAMMIESIKLSESDFNEGYEEEEEEQAAPPPADDEDGEDGEGAAPQTQKDDEQDIPEGIIPNYTDVTITYRVFYMQSPTEPDVGPDYNKQIWDTDQWRTAVAE